MANDIHHETALEATGARARLARVYAEALMAAADKQGQADALGAELEAVAAELAQHPGVEAFLVSAAVGRKARLPVLAAAFEGNASELFRKFVGVLNQNNRLGLLRAVNAAYQQLRDEAAGRVRVKVTSAVPLTDEQLRVLTHTLTQKLNADPVVVAKTNPDLLGGLVVQVHDTVYDTSVRTRLNNLRNHLMASASNV